MQDRYLLEIGSRFVFASDEFYCLSKIELPSYNTYEGFPQYENGVGLMKSFDFEIEEVLEGMDSIKHIKYKIIIATGTLAFDYMNKIVSKIKLKFDNLDITVVPIKNNFFGDTITVSGLITGNDLVSQLKGYKDADIIYIPNSMLRNGEDIFLDNLSLEEATKILEIKIKPCIVDGYKFIETLKLGVN